MRNQLRGALALYIGQNSLLKFQALPPVWLYADYGYYPLWMQARYSETVKILSAMYEQISNKISNPAALVTVPRIDRATPEQRLHYLRLQMARGCRFVTKKDAKCWISVSL